MKQIDHEIYENGFLIIDDFLGPQDYQSLLATAKHMHSKGQFKSAKIGQQFDATHNATIRSDEICWLEENSQNKAIDAYFSKIHLIAKLLNQTLFLGLQRFEIHFAIYQPGSYYRKHIDQFAKNKDRQISCVYYLNESWQESFAGQLKLYAPNEQLIANVLPQGNRFICFRSSLLHEVCETKQTRYSIAGWMKTLSSGL